MSISGAGGNKNRQLIGYVGPWSLVGDDFGPYAIPTGFSKVQFSTTGNGAGYVIGIYDGVDKNIDNAIMGTYNPDLGIRLLPQPPPPVPTAAYGAALAIPETSWSLTIGPSSQAGTGIEANPLVTTGVNAVKLLASYPIYYVRAKVQAIAGATGIIEVWAVAIP